MEVNLFFKELVKIEFKSHNGSRGSRLAGTSR